MDLGLPQHLGHNRSFMVLTSVFQVSTIIPMLWMKTLRYGKINNLPKVT